MKAKFGLKLQINHGTCKWFDLNMHMKAEVGRTVQCASTFGQRNLLKDIREFKFGSLLTSEHHKIQRATLYRPTPAITNAGVTSSQQCYIFIFMAKATFNGRCFTGQLNILLKLPGDLCLFHALIEQHIRILGNHVFLVCMCDC